MLRAIIISALLMCLNVQTAKADAVECPEFSQENDCIEGKLLKLKTQLNEIVLQIETTYKDNPQKLKKFKKAQKAWENFSLAQISYLYSNQDGTIRSTCIASAELDLLKARLKQLEELLAENFEGNVCNGLL